MVQPLKSSEILENLKLLSDWLRVKYPGRDEISEAIRFVLSIDNSGLREDDLRNILKEIGFDFDEINNELTE